ncbi:glycyl-tRNA synthetase beta chain [Erythrobacter litoralis]|uniref:Glycine--tRNA ligase beta subunit n=1 Tax=Erythrobacter litoralis TaxID=39960 RepID=A0A074N203_9SPHN|nr:glycine--tRNA ligase subunit beta [Erythrobacter litoralis]AOL23587.1 glycyl-tRNA synthetase beta chain [Erythrobacter litoralis]KEO98930.1 glycyl-tRNA synthetase subunit beta [Erythrobacter litoralis]
MADFLLELRSEEIPARMQAGARGELEKLFRREMEAAGIETGEVTVWSTPRRLALIARGLPEQTQAVREEAKGPPVGAPDQAVEGFCRKNGVTRESLEEREVKGRATYFAVIERPGQAVLDLLAAAIPAIIRDFSWPKSMRWGDASISSESTRWVRPLSGIVALLDGEVVPCVMEGLASGRETMGHRFHSSGPVTIDSAEDYAAKLREAFVIVDHEERAGIIREGARKAAKAAGLVLVEDEGLVVENAGLTEWPAPLLGRFDEAFLEVPPEVIQLSARVNQKYFVCEDKAGKLANAFVCTANIDALEPAVVVDGNRKVLAARLADARFFWEVDQKKTLEEHAKGLERITFHEKLGTLADKVERVAKLARWLCEEGIVDGDPDMAEKAARLCKADLVTEMVGEFPELQGLMGGYYARAEGLPDAVADAIRDHYKPVGQGDDVPTAPVTVAVSLADKLDTLRSFFAIDEKPTGSKDPFALRRAALGIIRLITESGLRMGVAEGDLLEFFADRLKVQQREAGVRHDLIDAVFALGGEDDLVRLLARVHALQSFVETENGANLLAGYKRAANILKKEEWDAAPPHAGEPVAETSEEDPLALAGKPEFDEAFGRGAGSRVDALSHEPEPAERALIEALDAAAPQAAKAVEEERFEDAMKALASLRAPIDAFFDEVTVNDDNPDKRSSRLDLLARFTRAVGQVADFSRIES